MGSLTEELQRREAAARQKVDELRGEIARLAERLARAEERPARLDRPRPRRPRRRRVGRQGRAPSDRPRLSTLPTTVTGR